MGDCNESMPGGDRYRAGGGHVHGGVLAIASDERDLAKTHR